MVTEAVRNADGEVVIVSSTAKASPPAVPDVEKILAPVRKQWVAFEGSLRKSLAHAIELGKRLIDAKARLPHGEFGRLFSDHREPVEGALPFQSRLGQKLMTVASNPVITNPSHATGLPADLTAVYELSLLTAPALEAAIEEGKVTPKTTREEAKALRREARGGEAEDKPRAPKVREERDPEDEIIDQFTHWHEWLAAFLERFPKQRARAHSLAKSLLSITEVR